MSDGVIEVHVPQENVNDDAVTINRWLVKDGARVEAGQGVVEVETSKADFEIPAPGAGIVRHLAKEGTDVPVGAAICLIGANEAALAGHGVSAAPVKAAAAVAESVTHANGAALVEKAAVAPTIGDVATRFSAAANVLIREHAVDAKVFAGKGLVRGEDVLAHLGKGSGAAKAEVRTTQPKGSTPNTVERTSPQPSLGVPVKIEKLVRSKQMEVRYLRSAYDNVIPSTVTVTARHFPAASDEAKASFSAIVLFETARLLKKYPKFNAFYAEGHCHYYQEINVGFAVDVGEGLRVVVIKNADQKTLAQIQDEQRELIVQCLSGELQPQALSGGTFTVTDLSGEGVSTFVPLINQGQSAILGVGAADTARGTYELILSFDHQLSEGRAAALFLKELRERLEAHQQNLAGEAGLAVQGVEAEIACYRCGTAAKDLLPGQFMLLGYTRNLKKPEPICTVCVQDF